MMKKLNYIFSIILFLALFPLVFFLINSPHNSIYYYAKGLRLENSLYAFEARDNFKKALAIDPSNLKYLVHYAWFLNSFNFIDDAISIFRIALQNPNSYGPNMYKALAWDELS